MRLMREPRWGGGRQGWETLEHPSSLLEGVIDALSAHLAILDRAGRIIGANRAWRRFGQANGLQDPAYCVGANYLTVCDRARGPNADEAPYVAENLRRLLAAKEGSFQCTYRCHSATEQRWFHLEGHCFTQGRKFFVTITHYNVTPVKRQSRQAARLKLNRVLEGMTDAFLRIDRNGRLTYVNHEAERIFGVDRQALLGNRLWDIFAAIKDSELYRRWQAGFTRESQFRFEEYLPASRRWFDVSAYGCGSGVAVSFRDITERKRAMHELRLSRQLLENHARQLEERVAERTGRLSESVQGMENFLYHVAHNLRAPLRASHGFGSLLLERHAQSLDLQGRHLLAQVLEASETMSALIDGLLDFGRLGLESSTLEAIELNEIIEEARRALEPEIKDRSPELTIQRAMPVACANRKILRRVLCELLSNAIKFVPAGVVPQVRISARQSGSTLRVVVHDNGIGIAPEQHEKIFQVFERLPHQTTYHGTGIGLALAKKGMHVMGGRIGIESEQGRGSRFWIELKAANPGDPAKSKTGLRAVAP